MYLEGMVGDLLVFETLQRGHEVAVHSINQWLKGFLFQQTSSIESPLKLYSSIAIHHAVQKHGVGVSRAFHINSLQ